MKITNLTEAKVKLTEDTLDYGKIKKGSNTTFQLLIEENEPISFVKNKNCGCFKVKGSNEDGKIKLDFTYDSNLLGEFNKPINIFYNHEGVEKRVTIKVKGNVR